MSLTLLRIGSVEKSVETEAGRKTLKNYPCRFADRKNKAFFILSGKADFNNGKDVKKVET